MAIVMPRGYRSTNEYHFSEEQTDAIVRTTAYHRKDFCLSVIWFSPREHIKIRPSIATSFQRPASVGLGSLDQLPLELLHDTLFHLDIRSLLKFRQVNIGSRQLVDSVNKYQISVSHGLNLLCALLRTGLASSVSLFDFYNALCTKTCDLCGEFGGFMSLLVWKRCCFKCLQEAPETQVRSLASIRKQFHLTKGELEQLKSFRTLPGIYSMQESVHKSRIAIALLFTKLNWFADGNHTHWRKPVNQTPNESRSSILWGRVHFDTTIGTLAQSNMEYRVPGVNLLSKKTLSAVGPKSGHSMLETKYMRETGSWNISDGANRHSSYGDRVTKVTTDPLSYLKLLGEGAPLIKENDKGVKSSR